MDTDNINNAVFSGTGNVERKKYDPLYEIVAYDGEETVIYIGRLFGFDKMPNLVTIKGVEYTVPKKKGQAKLTSESARKLLETAPSVEDVYSIFSLGRIRKIA